jgi:2-amino-4-hydroxy-6-hydroxymethyldihydropteridine diphosphokinase
MKTVFIALGSNLGERQKNIKQALDLIEVIFGIQLEKISSIIETDPLDGPPQGKYLNAVAQISTTLSPRNLLVELQKIEDKLGRVRTVKNAPRTIDLDILLFADLSINDPDLIVPHPRMFARYFVLKPLLEIAPDILLTHPQLIPHAPQIQSLLSLPK